MSRPRRMLLAVLYLGFLFGLAEIGSRGFWVSRYHMPFAGGHPLHSFYPTLADVEDSLQQSSTAELNILLLGGSVLDPRWSNVAILLRERLTYATNRLVRIHNLARPAHTTRDSRIKYEHLRAFNFDAVILYHGINDVRANAVPDSVFADDYSHFAWYGLVNEFAHHNPLTPVATPYTVRHLSRLSAQRLGSVQVAPRHRPRSRWLHHGGNVKTEGAFRANIQAILAIAADKGEPIVLGTFAYHIPPNYSREGFDRRELDYSLHRSPIELWGQPDHVATAVEVHNGVLRDMANASGQLAVLDFDGGIPKSGQYFNDVCHLTQDGAAVFVDLLVPTLLSHVQP